MENVNNKTDHIDKHFFKVKNRTYGCKNLYSVLYQALYT